MYKEPHFISIDRSETSTFSAFISNCGGLMGLFMGASLLSIVEIVYYLILWLFFKIRRQEIFQSVREIWVRRISKPIQMVKLRTYAELYGDWRYV